uniref:Putative transcription factor E2FB n=1 Tax=Davidia involucrata TaxID=16924 RepID=A0A5B7A064_DAVIN
MKCPRRNWSHRKEAMEVWREMQESLRDLSEDENNQNITLEVPDPDEVMQERTRLGNNLTWIFHEEKFVEINRGHSFNCSTSGFNENPDVTMVTEEMRLKCRDKLRECAQIQMPHRTLCVGS